jgi:putative efflux protein, MATE family
MFSVFRREMNGDSRLWREEFRATFALSWPIILTNLAQTALTTADVILTGRLGPEALAAGALGTNLYFACMIFGIGVVTATSPMIANTLGRNRRAIRDVRRTFRQGLWVIICLSVPVWLFLWHAEEILLLFGQTPSLAREAGRYVHALQWAYLPSLIYVLVRSFVATLERPQWALLICLLALPINIFIAWGLMFGAFGMPNIGLAGAGYATLSASIFMAAGMLVVVSVDPAFRRFYLLGRFWRPDWQRFFAIWRLGLPIGVTLVFEVLVFNISAFMMGIIGTQELAAHVIALQVSSLCFMVPVGLGQAASIRVGLANGARNRGGVTRAGTAAMTIALTFAVCAALMMVTIPHLLISIYVDMSNPANAQVIAFATTFLICAAIFQLGDGAQAVGSGMLRGLRDTRMPMLFAGVGYLGIAVPLGISLAFLTPLRGVGIWIGLATGLTLVAIAMLWRWSKRDRLNNWVE